MVQPGPWQDRKRLPPREVILAPADEGSSPNWPQDACDHSESVESKAVTLSWPEARVKSRLCSTW